MKSLIVCMIMCYTIRKVEYAVFAVSHIMIMEIMLCL